MCPAVQARVRVLHASLFKGEVSIEEKYSLAHSEKD